MTKRIWKQRWNEFGLAEFVWSFADEVDDCAGGLIMHGPHDVYQDEDGEYKRDHSPSAAIRQMIWVANKRLRYGYLTDMGAASDAEAYAVFQVLRGFVDRVVCLVRGHKLSDNGHATPDSGCICVECERCGYSYGTQWLY